MTVHYGDRDEVIEAGEAFVMPPGHVPEADAGTSFVMFSPADQLAATEAAIMAGMQAAHDG
jgi:quercetin dioxygenase-like cupin family protein